MYKNWPKIEVTCLMHIVGSAAEKGSLCYPEILTTAIHCHPFYFCSCKYLSSFLCFSHCGARDWSWLLLRGVCCHSGLLAFAPGRARELVFTAWALQSVWRARTPTCPSCFRHWYSKRSFSSWVIWEQWQCRRGVRVGQKKVLWFPVTWCWLRSCQSPWVFYHSLMVGQKLPLGLSDGKLRPGVGLAANDQINSPGPQQWKCISHIIRKITQCWVKDKKLFWLSLSWRSP